MPGHQDDDEFLFATDGKDQHVNPLFSSQTRVLLRLPMLRTIYSPEQKSIAETFRRSQLPKPTDEMDYEQHLQLKTGEDAIAFFARYGSTTPVKFVYCNRADRASGARDDYRPYDLVVVPRKKVKSEYFTISASGVVHIQPDEASEVTPLAEWSHQSAMFNVLRKIRAFKHYLDAKMFRQWRANVRYRIFCKQRQAVQQSLFLARPSFCQPLFEVNKIMTELDTTSLTRLKADVCQVETFTKDQTDQRAAAAKKLESLVERMQAVVHKVCEGVKERARAYDHSVANDDLNNSRFAHHLMGGNTKAKPMHTIKRERAERIRLLKHAIQEANMLGDFIRLVDYMEVEHLTQIATTASAEFLRELQTQRKAFFWTTVTFGENKQQLQFSPTNAEMHRTMNQMLDGLVATADTVERIIETPRFKPYFAAPVPDYPKVDVIVKQHKAFITAKSGIDHKVNEDFLTAEQTISFLERHRPVYDFGEQWSFEKYSASEHTVEGIEADMRQQVTWTIGIKRIRDFYDAGMFQVVTRKLKMHLLPITANALAGMRDLLLRLFHDQCLSMMDQFQQRMKQLDHDPAALAQFANYVETFNRIKGENRDLHDRTRKISMMHRLLVEHEVRISSHDAVAYDDLQAAERSFDAQLIVAEQRIRDRMDEMHKLVYKNIGRLNGEIEAQKHVLEEGIFIDDKAAPKDVLKDLDRVKVSLDEVAQATRTLQGYQVLFETEPYPFNTLPDAFAVYDRKRLLWSTYASWLEKTKYWNNEDFLALSVEKMDDEVKEFFQTACDLQRTMRNSTVATRLKDSVADWRGLMRPILELGNKALKPAHWRQLFTAMGLSFASSEKIRLKKLRASNVLSHTKLISDICAQAVEEDQLTSALSKVQTAWARQQFVVPRR